MVNDHRLCQPVFRDMGGLRRSGARARALVRDGVVAHALAVEVLRKTSCDCHVRLPGCRRGRRIGCHRGMPAAPRRLRIRPHATSARHLASSGPASSCRPDSRCRRRGAVEPAECIDRQTGILGARLSGRMLEATGSACSLPSITRRWITTYLSRRARQTVGSPGRAKVGAAGGRLGELRRQSMVIAKDELVMWVAGVAHWRILSVDPGLRLGHRFIDSANGEVVSRFDGCRAATGLRRRMTAFGTTRSS